MVNAWFTDDNITGLETSIASMILDEARVVTVNGIPRKILGTLLITDRDIVVVPIPVNPDKTITPTPSVTFRPPIWYSKLKFEELHNLFHMLV